MKHRVGYTDGQPVMWKSSWETRAGRKHRAAHYRSGMIARFLLALAFTVGAFGGPLVAGPANASGPVVMVESHVTGRYDVLLRRAVKFTDQFTMSHMVFGECVSGKRCLIVRYDSTLPLGRATTDWVTVNGRWVPGQRINIKEHLNSRYSNAQVLRSFEHELGHAFGLSHAKGCNIMMPVISCVKYGVRYLPREWYTAEQRRILGRS
jgi:hypothetical protein